MPRLNIKIDMNASQKRIFDILDHALSRYKWHLTANGKSIRTETVEPEKISMKIEGGILNSVGGILSPKGDLVEVTLWGEYDDENNEKLLVKQAELLLNAIKEFAEVLEEGGSPDDFDKRQINVAP